LPSTRLSAPSEIAEPFKENFQRLPLRCGQLDVPADLNGFTALDLDEGIENLGGAFIFALDAGHIVPGVAEARLGKMIRG